MRRSAAFLILVVTFVLSSAAVAGDLSIHEWGTFTSFQDEQGQALDYINTDDEPVPTFVHQIGTGTVLAPTQFPQFTQGAPTALSGVTMRLETPVLYFHLPENAKPRTLDVAVDFQGGWLTQYYPNAVAQIDQKEVVKLSYPPMKGDTVGTLVWKNLRIGGDGKGPETHDPVWKMPRKVQAANVTIDGESERFLFYRGVGHLDSPVKVIRENGSLRIRDNGSLIKMHLPIAWLLEVRPDGSSAYRALAGMNLGRSAQDLLTTSATFDERQFAAQGTKKLKQEMHHALRGEGLNADEADALLNTWQLSYFQSPGQRVFFIVPQAWTNTVLPLRVSEDAEIQRAMVGRIELVTPRQRAVLNELAALPLPDLKEVSTAMARLQATDHEKYNALASGAGNLDDLGVAIPDAYRKFLALGRFRVSLLLNAKNQAITDLIYEFEFPGQGVAQSIRQQRNSVQ